MGKNNNKNVSVKTKDAESSEDEKPTKLEKLRDVISEDEHNKNLERLEKIKV